MLKDRIVNIVGLVILVFIVGLFIIGLKKEENKLAKVNIVRYEYDTNDIAKKVKIDNKKDIKMIEDIIKDLKPLSGDEMVKLALMQDIVIEYNNNITIGIQEGIKGYCYYTNKDKNISGLARMPKGLYNWTINKLK